MEETINLHKSWEEKIENRVIDWDLHPNDLNDNYIKGASDFQKRAIEELEKAKIEDIEGEDYLPINVVIEIIKELKAE